MTQQEFRFQIERLRETYGKDKYPEPRVYLLWERLKLAGAVCFERAVSGLILECKTAPMAKDLLEAMEEQKEYDWKKQKAEENRVGGDIFRRAMSDPNSFISFGVYVANLFENERDSEDFNLAVKLYGRPRLELIYEEYKKTQIGNYVLGR